MSLLDAVKVLSPGATEALVEFYLSDVIEQAQPCLNNYSEAAQNKALAYLYAHLSTLSQGGQVTQESTRTGASRSYAAPTQGDGIRATHYGRTLVSMTGAAQCLLAVVDKPDVFMHTVGGHK